MMIRQRLEAMSVRDLREVLAWLRGGSIGFDPNRHPVASKKPGLIDYILESGLQGERPPTTARLIEVIADVTGGDPLPMPATWPEPELPLPEQTPASRAATPAQEPAPMPTPAPAATPATLDPAALAALAGALAALVPQSASVDPDTVREIVRAELNNRPPHRIEIITPDKTKRTTEGHRHPQFEKVLRLASAGLNVMMTGPAGSGKTTLAAHVAEALGRPFGMISLTAGASESQLLGRFLPTGEAGRFEYTDTPFMRAYERGGVFLLDEFDAADPNLAIVLNAATSGSSFFNDYRSEAPEVKRHADTVILAACNTYGTGADAIYSGRNQLDAATLDRFYTVAIDYDEAIDLAIGDLPASDKARPWKAANGVTSSDLRALVEWTLAVRAKIAESKLRRVFSHRATDKAVRAATALIPVEEVKRDLLAGWTRDELAKLGTLAPAGA